MRWKDGSGRCAAPFAVAGRSRGSGRRGPRPGDVGGSRSAFVRARHHGLLRLAPTLRVYVARVGQVDVVPVGVSDRQVLLGCVAWPCAFGLYKGSFWAGLARPGSSWFMAECAVVGVTSIGWQVFLPKWDRARSKKKKTKKKTQSQKKKGKIVFSNLRNPPNNFTPLFGEVAKFRTLPKKEEQ